MEKGTVEFLWIKGDDNVADGLTKPLEHIKFHVFANYYGWSKQTKHTRMKWITTWPINPLNSKLGSYEGAPAKGGVLRCCSVHLAHLLVIRPSTTLKNPPCGLSCAAWALPPRSSRTDQTYNAAMPGPMEGEAQGEFGSVLFVTTYYYGFHSPFRVRY